MPEHLPCKVEERLVPTFAPGMIVCLFGTLLQLRKKSRFRDWWEADVVFPAETDGIDFYPVREREITLYCGRRWSCTASSIR